MWAHVDFTLASLITGILFFTVVVLAIERWYPNDGQLFQLFSGILTGFVGAFLGRIIPKNGTEQTPNGDVKP